MDRLFRIDFYPQDWLLKTSRLTPEQRGIYIQIVSLIYAQCGPIDNDAVWIAGTCKCSARLVRSVVDQLQALEFIQVSADKISQRRAERELGKKREHLDRSSKGGRPKAEPVLVPNDNSILVLSESLVGGPSPSPSLSPIASNESKEGDKSPSLGKGVAGVMAEVWNSTVSGKIPKIAKLDDTRSAKMKKRLDEYFDGDIAGWTQCCRRIADSPHLTGNNDRQWTATIDWVLSPSNLTKIVEGNYDRKNGNGKPTHSAKPNSPHANLFAGFGVTDLE